MLSVEWGNDKLSFFENYLSEKGIFLNPEDAFLEILAGAQNQITEIVSSAQEDAISAKSELNDLLLKDPDFQKCTNQSLRKRYLRNMFDPNYRYYDLSKKLGDNYNPQISMFCEGYPWIEDLWREYKATK